MNSAHTRDDTVIDRTGIEHAYAQIADAIAARIAAGYYTPKLPAERDLAKEFGVSYITLRNATAILRERGLIITSHGRGTFVAPDHRTPASGQQNTPRRAAIAEHI